MKAAVLFGVKEPFRVCDVTIDKPAAHEVLVRVAASGLCHSDFHFVSGDLPNPMPCVIGHEVAGIVEAIGAEVTTVTVGDHVVGGVSTFCGHCHRCVSGQTHLCTAKPKRGDHERPRLSLNGETVSRGVQLCGYAEQILVHENGVVAVDRALPLDRAALLGCGVLTGLGSVFNTAKVTPGSKVAVIGCGGVGLNVIQGAKLAGADRIVAVDLMPEKRALAARLGATHVVEGGPDAVAAVRDMTNGGVDYSFEVIGLASTMVQAVEMLAPGGLMTIVGAMPLTATFPISGVQMLLNEWRIQGAFMGSSPFVRDIPRFGALYMQGRLELDALIAERIDLSQINEGFETMLGATQTRSVITFPDILADAAARA